MVAADADPDGSLYDPLDLLVEELAGAPVEASRLTQPLALREASHRRARVRCRGSRSVARAASIRPTAHGGPRRARAGAPPRGRRLPGTGARLGALRSRGEPRLVARRGRPSRRGRPLARLARDGSNPGGVRGREKRFSSPITGRLADRARGRAADHRRDRARGRGRRRARRALRVCAPRGGCGLCRGRERSRTGAPRSPRRRGRR